MGRENAHRAADLRHNVVANGAACTAPEWDVMGMCG